MSQEACAPSIRPEQQTRKATVSQEAATRNMCRPWNTRADWLWLAVLAATSTSANVGVGVSAFAIPPRQNPTLAPPGTPSRFWLSSPTASSGARDDATTTTSSSESMRLDIEQLKKEAQERLLKLEAQMDDLKQQQHDLKQHDQLERQQQRQQGGADEVAAVGAVLEKTKEDATTPSGSGSLDALSVTTNDVESSISSTTVGGVELHRDRHPHEHRLELLQGTRWKIVLNLGREAGTWMPPAWGASGARLLIEVVVDFTDVPIDYATQADEFFQGVAGCYQLRVVEAFTFPMGVGRNSVGRRSVDFGSVGSYKVVPGQGPRGTDLLRLALDAPDDPLLKHDDVACPPGRVYGTCGYFPLPSRLSTSVKDQLAKEHHALAAHYEQLKIDDEQDGRLWNKMGRLRELYQVRQQLDRLTVELQQARQAQPDRSELRLSRDGQVGLSREGGLCCKVQKGLVAVEYHILGRMEVACVRKPDDEDDVEHDEYQELVHQLHP